MSQYFQLMRKFYYSISGCNAFGIHSQHVYDYYIRVYLNYYKSGVDKLVKESKKWWIKEFKGCSFITYNLDCNNYADISTVTYQHNPKKDLKDEGMQVKSTETAIIEKRGNLILIYENINIDETALEFWRNELKAKSRGLSIETLKIGIIFLIDGFSKQHYIIRKH